MRRHPLIPVALFYAGGVLLGEFLSVPFARLLAAALTLLLTAVFVERARLLLLAPLLVLLGWTNLARQAAALSPHDLRRVTPETNQIVTLRGVLVETPYQRVFEQGETESWRTLAQLEATALRMADGPWQPAAGRVAISTPGILASNYFGGQSVEVTGVLRAPSGPVVEGQFDYRAYLRRFGIHRQLRTDNTNDWRMRAPALAPPLTDRFLRWAQATLARGLPEPDEELRLLWAMTLGWKTALTDEVAEPFMRSGTMHIFAISGLHIVLLAKILQWTLGLLPLPRLARAALLVPLLWAYTMVTGWQASAIRSTVMMTVLLAGESLERPGNLLNSLFTAGLLILLWAPQQLFLAGFQLSFGVVLMLGLFERVIQQASQWLRQRPDTNPLPGVAGTGSAYRFRWPGLRRLVETWWWPEDNRSRGWLSRCFLAVGRGLRELISPDPFLPEELRPRWQVWSRGPARWLWQNLEASFAACLGSIPLIAVYFHLFTPVSLFANVIVVPLSGLALGANLAGLLTGGWWPWATECFNHSAWLFMKWMIVASRWAADVPGGCWNVASPSGFALAWYYIALISLLAGWWNVPRVRRWVFATLLLLALATFGQWRYDRAVTRLTCVPLNGGESVFLQPARGGGTWLIDCGDENSARMVTKPFLRSRGVNWLDHLVVTHGERRNVGGAELIRDAFRAKHAHASLAPFRSGSYRQLLEQWMGEPKFLETCQRADSVGPWRVLHPGAEDRFPQADDNTLVLQGIYHGTRVMLLSDLGKPGQNVLMEHKPDLRADIVIAGLPQKGEPLADALLDAMKPRVIVITDAEYPANQRATDRLRDRLKQRGVPVFYTSEAGAVTIEFRGKGWTLRTRDGVAVRSAELTGGRRPGIR